MASPLAPRNDVEGKDEEKDKDKEKEKDADEGQGREAGRRLEGGEEGRGEAERAPEARGDRRRRASRSASCCCRRRRATTTAWPRSPASSSTAAPRARAAGGREEPARLLGPQGARGEDRGRGRRRLRGRRPTGGRSSSGRRKTTPSSSPSPTRSSRRSSRTKDLERTIDPRAEWRQIFDDAWRFERDYFYDPGLHGVNWTEMRQRYGRLLEDAVTRWDVNFVIGEMIAELNSSHTYRGGGDLEEGLKRGVGMLGVDFALENGAYRIKRILRGAPWDTEVRSPLDRPGVDVQEGDYLLAVDHVPLDVGKDPWAAFQGLAEKTVLLTVNAKPTLAGRPRGAGRDARRRGPPAQPRLDRGEPPQGGRGDEGPRRLRLRAGHRDGRPDRARAPVHRPVPEGGARRRRALQQRRADPGPLRRAAQPAALQLLGGPRRPGLAVAAGRPRRARR